MEPMSPEEWSEVSKKNMASYRVRREEAEREVEGEEKEGERSKREEEVIERSFPDMGIYESRRMEQDLIGK
jgi:hypothetical protein